MYFVARFMLVSLIPIIVPELLIIKVLKINIIYEELSFIVKYMIKTIY